MPHLKSITDGTASVPYSSRKYIDEIPPDKREKLCTEIDYTLHKNEGYWQKLIDRLGFDETHSKKFKLSFEMHGSPTDNLLRDCAYRMLRIRHLYQILTEIGLLHLAEAYLKDYDLEEALPQCPLPFHVNSYSSLRNDPSVYNGAPDKASLLNSKGPSRLAIDTIHFLHEDIKVGTHNFSPKMELGAGAFGKVYKVVLNNTLFACKVLKIDKENMLTNSLIEKHRQHDDLRNELNYLAEYRHPNVIALYGWSLDGPDPCLIYDYMKNGSLQDRLQCLENSYRFDPVAPETRYNKNWVKFQGQTSFDFRMQVQYIIDALPYFEDLRANGSKPMDWETRIKVSCGAARGLQFLHTMKSKPLIHGDIKTANILLDNSFTAKLGDFGLAREMPRNATTGSYIRLGNEHTPGTLGYLAIEYIETKKLSVQVDTYAFGVVLLELYTGRRAYDRSTDSPLLRDYMDDVVNDVENLGEEKTNVRLLRLQDPRIAKLNQEPAFKFVRLALSCCHLKRKERPKMSRTLEELTKIAGAVALANGKEPEEHIQLSTGGEKATNTLKRKDLILRHSSAPSDANNLSPHPVESEMPGKSDPEEAMRLGTGKPLSSIEKQVDQMKIHYHSSSDNSDSLGRSSSETTRSEYYYVRDNNYPPDQMHPGYSPAGLRNPVQFGYFPSPHVAGYSPTPVMHYSSQPFHHPQSQNIGDPMYPHGVVNGVNPVRVPDAHLHDQLLYGPGRFSCPTKDPNPYRLDLNKVRQNHFYPCDPSQLPHPSNVSPLQSQNHWAGQAECSPFSSVDYEGPASFVKMTHLNREDSQNCHPGPSYVHRESRGAANNTTQTPTTPTNSSNYQTSSSMNPPVSINPIKESMLDKLNEGQSYTQIFYDSPPAKRVPTESSSDGTS